MEEKERQSGSEAKSWSWKRKEVHYEGEAVKRRKSSCLVQEVAREEAWGARRAVFERAGPTVRGSKTTSTTIDNCPRQFFAAALKDVPSATIGRDRGLEWENRTREKESLSFSHLSSPGTPRAPTVSREGWDERDLEGRKCTSSRGEIVEWMGAAASVGEAGLGFRSSNFASSFSGSVTGNVNWSLEIYLPTWRTFSTELLS